MRHIKKETIARTIALVIALLNQILAVTGKEILPFGEDSVYQFVSLGLTLTTSLIAWWKNNSFTKPAIASDIYLNLFRKLDKREKEAKKCASA